MALQLRRGTNAERLQMTPLEGELIYTTDTKELFIGDGATIGGQTVISNSNNIMLSDVTASTYNSLLDNRPINPFAGTIIFDGDTSTFQGWNGTNWVTLG
jgi:hypothetical protein